MHVKRFEAADMAEALRLVKLELGPNAVILSTRQIKKGSGAFGIFGRSFVEITAAVDREAIDTPRPVPQPHPSAAAPASRRESPKQPGARQAQRRGDCARARRPPGAEEHSGEWPFAGPGGRAH